MDDRLRDAFLPDLELIRALGSGPTAEVFLAREVALQRLVAVKVLRADVAADEVVRQRFEREAQSAARIVHANVTAIYRVGRIDDSRPFIVMEYVDGRTLADMLPPAVTFDEPTARRLLGAVASALDAAHQHGVIHRDVRPGNVLVENRTGRAVLGDFGIAALLESGAGAAKRLTAAGVILGDARHLSPEQVRGESPLEQSDVYAFGILAFEMLTGRGPYSVRTPAELFAAHLQQQPTSLRELRPDVSPGLAELLMRCLAKEPAQRPLANELAARLAAPADAPVDDPGSSSIAVFLSELRRRHVYRVAAAYAAVALATFGVAEVIYDAFELPVTFYRVVVSSILGGFPVTLVLAWLYDIRGGGIQRTPDVDASGRTRILLWSGLGLSLLFAVLIGWLLLRRG
jgi:serine/threonine protein kinase